MPEEIVCNTSCLIAFSNIDSLEILEKLYKTILILESVVREFGEITLKNAKVVPVKVPLQKLLTEELNLGDGEAQAIALASSVGKTLILDDQKARKTAQELGLKITGTIGLLLKAEKKKLITSAYEKAVELKKKGFFISNKILKELKN